MTAIQGILQDSGLGTFNAKLYVTLDSPITIDTTPKTLLVPKTKIIDITAGIVDFSLEESESEGVTYTFELFEVDNLNAIIEPSVLLFKAVVPNDTSVDFSDLIPTGFINSQLDSGARRISKLIINNPFFNTGIKDLSKPFVSVTKSANQTSSLSSTPVTFDTETIDTNGVWSSSELTVPLGFGGYFALSGVLPVTNVSGAAQTININARLNNTTLFPLVGYTIANNTTLDCIIPYSVLSLVAGDIVELVVTTAGGFSYTINATKSRLNIGRLPL